MNDTADERNKLELQEHEPQDLNLAGWVRMLEHTCEAGADSCQVTGLVMTGRHDPPTGPQSVRLETMLDGQHQNLLCSCAAPDWLLGHRDCHLMPPSFGSTKSRSVPHSPLSCPILTIRAHHEHSSMLQVIHTSSTATLSMALDHDWMPGYFPAGIEDCSECP